MRSSISKQLNIVDVDSETRFTYPFEDWRKDTQSHQPESDDNEYGALAIEYTTKCHGTSYRQVPVDAHRRDGEYRGGNCDTCKHP